MSKTRDFAQVIRKKLASDPDLAAVVEQETFNANVAQEIYDARIEAGLTQTQLASKIGTHQSVIARLEDADYDGHSLTMLNKIFEALSREVYPMASEPTTPEEVSDAREVLSHLACGGMNVVKAGRILARRVHELESKLNQVDDVLVVNWVDHNGEDYRKALNDLIAWNILVANDPSVSEDAKRRRDRLESAEAVIDARINGNLVIKMSERYREKYPKEKANDD